MDIQLFPKQIDAFESTKPITTYVGGIQCGKTTVGGLWMALLAQQFDSPDDNFIITAPDYKTLSQATLPRFLKFARVLNLGRYNQSRAEFKLKTGGTIYCRTATHPESMEGITDVRGIWGDEAGQFSRYFYENMEGRAALREAPMFLTTTPYSMNWLNELASQAKEGKRDDVNLIQLRSIDSPYFPKKKYEEQEKRLHPRRFAMKYMGLFGEQEGLVYDIYKQCLIQSFQLPLGTKYYAGIDWGYSPDPFVLVVRAVTPEGFHYRTAEYYRNFLTISDVVNVVRSYHALHNFQGVFCDPSQPAHIEELNRCGIPAQGAKNDIRFGIDKHYALMKTGKFFMFEDCNPHGKDEYSTYHYPEEKELKVDEGLSEKARLPVDKSNHGVDADRYTSVMLLDGLCEKRTPKAPAPQERPTDLAKRIAWLKAGGSSRYARN